MRRLVILFVVVLVAAACGDDGGGSADPPGTTQPTSSVPSTTAAPTTTTEPASTTSAPPAVRASVGCDAPADVVEGVTSVAFTTTAGRERTYGLFVPASYTGDPTPLVLDFHGFSSNGDQQAALSGLRTLAEEEGFVVVHPFGSVDPNLGQTYWNIETDDDPDTVDDVAFVDELLDRLEAGLCLDLDRIHSTGMSNGGFISARLACDLADRIASIGTVTGVSYYDDCDPVRAVPVVHFHGLDDPIVPFGGGTSTIFDIVPVDVEVDADTLAGFFVSIPGEMAEWAERNGCGTEPEITEISEEVELREYPDCAGAEVDFYVFAGGHTWPGSPLFSGLEEVVGATTFDVDATSVIWEWFERHPLG